MKNNNKEHSMLSNIFFFIRLLYTVDPLYVIGELVWGVVMFLPTRLISVIGIKYVIDVYESGERLERIYYAVGVIAGILIFSRVFSWLFREFYWNMAKEKVYYGLNKRLYEKARELDLASYDNPDFYTDFILTIESSSDNIQNLMNLVRNYFADLIALVAVSSVLVTIDPVCLLIIFAVVFAFMPLSKKVGKLQMDRRTDNAKYHRRSDYFQR
ncbi:MAG: hypothetical protein IKS12_06710, partial [Eubacterium sp.]|nr:hypothetical protein [Eubacterium sp.]